MTAMGLENIVGTDSRHEYLYVPRDKSHDIECTNVYSEGGTILRVIYSFDDSIDWYTTHIRHIRDEYIIYRIVHKGEEIERKSFYKEYGEYEEGLKLVQERMNDFKIEMMTKGYTSPAITIDI